MRRSPSGRRLLGGSVLLTAVLGVLVPRETLAWPQALGLLLVVGGMALLARGQWADALVNGRVHEVVKSCHCEASGRGNSSSSCSKPAEEISS